MVGFVLPTHVLTRISRARKPSANDIPSALAPPVKDTGRARVLMPSSQSYEIAPANRVVAGNNAGAMKPMNARGDDFIRKMKAKKAKKVAADKALA